MISRLGPSSPEGVLGIDGCMDVLRKQPQASGRASTVDAGHFRDGEMFLSATVAQHASQMTRHRARYYAQRNLRYVCTYGITPIRPTTATTTAHTRTAARGRQADRRAQMRATEENSKLNNSKTTCSSDERATPPHPTNDPTQPYPPLPPTTRPDSCAMNHKIEDPTSHSAEILYFCFDPHQPRTRYPTPLIASEEGHHGRDLVRRVP